MSIKFRFRSSVFLLIFLLVLTSLSIGFIDEKTDQVDALLAQWDKTDSPGCALAIIQEGEQSSHIEITQEDSPLLRYKSFEPIRPTTEKFKEYTGEYSSDELDTTFKIELIKSRLRFTHRNALPGTLQTNYKDIFRIGNLRLIFSRDGNDQIDSFTVNAGRVTNLRFYKK